MMDERKLGVPVCRRSKEKAPMKYLDRTIDGFRVYLCVHCGRMKVDLRERLLGFLGDSR